jgi:hypothetical protein
VLTVSQVNTSTPKKKLTNPHTFSPEFYFLPKGKMRGVDHCSQSHNLQLGVNEILSVFSTLRLGSD